jgi:hypothetical protein
MFKIKIIGNKKFSASGEKLVCISYILDCLSHIPKFLQVFDKKRKDPPDPDPQYW